MVMIKKTYLALLFAASGVLGCAEESSMTPQFRNFLKECMENDEKNTVGMGSYHEFSGKYKLVYADKVIYSFRAEELSYTGGAHGNMAVTVGTLRRSDNSRLKIKDIAPTPLKRARLLNLITYGTARHFKCKNSELKKYLLAMPFLTENFYINQAGITFVFNEYEIASKSCGPISITIPLKDFPIRPEDFIYPQN